MEMPPPKWCDPASNVFPGQSRSTHIPAYLLFDFIMRTLLILPKWEFEGLPLIFCQSFCCMLIISLTNSQQFLQLLPENKIFYIFLFFNLQ